MVDAFLLPRNKSGIWGWRSEKMEVVSGYEAKVGTAGGRRGDPAVPGGGADAVPGQVYSASNVELVTKTRTEHLSDQDKSRSKGDSPVGQSGSLPGAGGTPPPGARPAPSCKGHPLLRWDTWAGVGWHAG